MKVFVEFRCRGYQAESFELHLGQSLYTRLQTIFISKRILEQVSHQTSKASQEEQFDFSYPF